MKECQGLVRAYGMGLRLSQFYIDHALSLCSIFFPAFHLDRTNLGSKVSWVGFCFYPSTKGPALLQEMASSRPMSLLLGISAKVNNIDSWEPPYLLGLWYFLDIPHPLADADFHPFYWPSGPLSCLAPHLILTLLFWPSSPLPSSSLPPSASYD